MKNYQLVRIKTNNKSNILLKLNKIQVDIKNIRYQNAYLIFEIKTEDLKRVKKYLISEKIEILDEIGLNKIKKELKKNLLFIISIIFATIAFLILSNIIVKVNVIHSSKEIRELLETALNEHGVKALTRKKSYDEYEEIIADIKNKYKDKIEWLEIDVKGMVLNVRIEERIANKEEENYETCHIVANKSGIIKNLYIKKGVAEVKMNDFVKKGDILINGEIKLNDEIKNNVCAEGSVMAEVWYQVNASIPLKYNIEEDTKKTRINFMLKNNFQEIPLLKSRVGTSKRVENKLLFKIFGWEFYLQKEIETKNQKLEYTEKEALEELTKIIHEKLETQGLKVADIIEEKYLKKNVNNGNLDIGMFISIKEQIGVRQYYKIETDRGTNDENDNGDNNNINR